MKRKLDYWGRDISEIRKHKRSQIRRLSLPKDEDMPEVTHREDYNELTTKQLREVVKERGLGTKGLSKLKEQELIGLIERGSS